MEKWDTDTEPLETETERFRPLDESQSTQQQDWETLNLNEPGIFLRHVSGGHRGPVDEANKWTVSSQLEAHSVSESTYEHLDLDLDLDLQVRRARGIVERGPIDR